MSEMQLGTAFPAESRGKITHHFISRACLRLPFLTTVSAITYQFLLLGVDRHHQLTALQELICLRIDVLELRIPVSIKMAMMTQPNLLFSDEPTTALDATHEAQIIAFLREIQNEVGWGMILLPVRSGAGAMDSCRSLQFCRRQDARMSLASDPLCRRDPPATRKEGNMNSNRSVVASDPVPAFASRGGEALPAGSFRKSGPRRLARKTHQGGSKRLLPMA